MSNQETCTECQEHLKIKQQEWEKLCIRCGGCCGAYDDPCQHLLENEHSQFYCSIYAKRFGTRKSVKGEEFDCVTIKEVINTYWKNDHLCIYKKYLKTPLLMP